MSDASKRLEKADKYLQKGKVEDALSELLAAVDDDPENNLVCERAADICISQNRHKDAAGLLAGTVDRRSASRGQAKALINYKKPARISTPRAEQTCRFGRYLEKSEKKEERDGHAWFERAYNLDSNNPDTALAYGDSLVARGDGATALRVVQPLAKKDDAPELVQQVYARALLAQRRPKDAEPIIRRL